MSISVKKGKLHSYCILVSGELHKAKATNGVEGKLAYMLDVLVCTLEIHIGVVV